MAPIKHVDRTDVCLRGGVRWRVVATTAVAVAAAVVGRVSSLSSLSLLPVIFPAKPALPETTFGGRQCSLLFIVLN